MVSGGWKSEKLLVTARIDDTIDRMSSQVKSLKHHIYMKRMQVKCYNEIKENFDENEILIHVDYSENYETSSKVKYKVRILGIQHLAFSLPAAI